MIVGILTVLVKNLI